MRTKNKKIKTNTISINMEESSEQPHAGIRLPLDLILIYDVEDLEDALNAKWAVEHEQEIFFCQTDEDLQDLILDFDNNYTYYRIDEIELDRIKAIIDLLNKAEEDVLLGHILDRIVR